MLQDIELIVIDNNDGELSRLIDLLEEAFPGVNVWPSRDDAQTFKRWDDVFEHVKNIPRDLNVVLCLDVALGEEDFSDATRGLERAGDIRAMRRDWVLVAYTRFSARIASEPSYADYFDGLIEKGNMDGKSRRQRLDYVKKSIESAVRRKTNTETWLPPDATILDSMGMRVFRAAFGDASISEIIRNEGSDWRNIRLEALTTGHSGAFMLSISGKSKEGGHSLVLKVARDQRIIEQETRAQQKFLGQLGALAGHLAVLDNECIRLGKEAGVYYRQAHIDGVPLLDILKGSYAGFGRDLVMKRTVDLCVNVCCEVISRQGVPRPAGDFFGLTPVDVGRIESSVAFLSALGESMMRHRLFDFEGFGMDVIGGDLLSLAKGWQRWVGLRVNLLGIVQHGDLNPGNVIITRDGSPVLIDLARLGLWPVGYDLARLSLMLRLRLVDWDEVEDWFHFGLSSWLSEATAHVGETDGDAICLQSVYCDQRFGEFLGKLEDPRQAIVGYGYKLGTLWDLLKVISYQDASPYKRMWAMIEAWRLKNRLEEELELMSEISLSGELLKK